MKRKITKDAKKRRERERERSKEEQKQYFQRLYDKPKVINFRSWDEVDMKKHFFFPAIHENWGFGPKTPRAALAVYPVLCSRADFRDYEKWFPISEENIAKLTGISPNTAREGIEHLLNVGYGIIYEGEHQCYLLERKMEYEGKRHFYVYRAGFLRENMISNWHCFKFYTCIIDTGIWAKLKPRAKALYLALRSCSRFDREAYALVEYGAPTEEVEEIRSMPSKDFYDSRKWEICDIPTAHLCRLVNIDPTNLQGILEQLEDYGLVEKIDRWYKVYLKPKFVKIN